MAWSWSHTIEAYADAEQNLRELDLDTLRVIWSEWQATSYGDEPSFAIADFNADDYEAALDRSASFDAETLADDIWEHAAEQQTCDNGGWNAWMCPYGCHTVAFDRGESDSEL
jgi:hypothetical protein